jgi:hypothetical protein
LPKHTLAWPPRRSIIDQSMARGRRRIIDAQPLKAHLGAPQIRQILHGRTPREVDFEVHGGEVRSRTPCRNASRCFGRYARFFAQSGADPM